MLLPKSVFERFLNSYDAFIASHREAVNKSLDQALSAHSEASAAVVSAKNDEVVFLKEQLSRLAGQIEHERARAEAAIDRLLQIHNVVPVADADLIRDAKSQDLEKRPVVKKEFQEFRAVLNSAGEDFGPEPSAALFAGMAAEGE